MSERKHALLSASSASRWLECTPSARFEENFPERTSSYADEGTLAHSIGELIIRYRLKLISKAEYQQKMDHYEEHEHYGGESMFDYCSDYAAYVLERFALARKRSEDAEIFIEYALDTQAYIPEGFGTTDIVIVADGFIETIDLKYGKGKPVAVVENKQQMIYALGALSSLAKKFHVKKVRMTVYQPRIDNIDSWEIMLYDLKEWATKELKIKAALAFEGLGEFVPGEHCQFCRGKSQCKALANLNLEIAKYEFAESNVLSDEAIADILSRADVFINWINAVKEYALQQALHGKKWPGYKLVAGIARRKYADPSRIAEILLTMGFEDTAIHTKKLLPITSLESEIGKNMFAKLVTPLVVKPEGKVTLVPSSDKRPEYNSVASAAEGFKD